MEVKTDTTEIQRTERKYYEQLHDILLDNMEKNKFLEIYNLLKLNRKNQKN